MWDLADILIGVEPSEHASAVFKPGCKRRAPSSRSRHCHASLQTHAAAIVAALNAVPREHRARRVRLALRHRKILVAHRCGVAAKREVRAVNSGMNGSGGPS
jgi:hypothetical protein